MTTELIMIALPVAFITGASLSLLLKFYVFGAQTLHTTRRHSLLLVALFVSTLSALSAAPSESSNIEKPLTANKPDFGYGFFESTPPEGLVHFWGSENPGLRNMSALETARKIWKSESPTQTFKSLLPKVRSALLSKNPNDRRAVSDFVVGLWGCGGMRNGLSVRIADKVKNEGSVIMREELGKLLPIVCKNIKEDSHTWARTGAVSLARNIIAPKWAPADGSYEVSKNIIRPLLLNLCNHSDKFMRETAVETLLAIGVDGLDPATLTKAMITLIEKRLSASSTSALNILSQLSVEHLSEVSQALIDALADDSLEGANKCGTIAADILLKIGHPKAPAAVIDYVSRERHGHGLRSAPLYPKIRDFTEDQLRSALPELKRFAIVEEARGRRVMGFARGNLGKFEGKKVLKPAEKVTLENAKIQLANPPHEWVLELFDRIGEPRPAVGEAVTGNNPFYKTNLSIPPWIPKNVDAPVTLSETDGLAGKRAMDLLPLETGKPYPIETRAFSTIAPEDNCKDLSVQIKKKETVYRRPLGPTGILGTFSDRRILVVGTQPGSPSHNKVIAGDWILGVNSRYFTDDPIIGMGWAIEESESRNDGAMTLKVLRNGKPIDLTINLQTLGRHVDTWPYGCEKSDKILDDLCEFIVRHDAKYVIPGALVLMASGKEKYMPEVRQEVYSMASKGPSTNNWFSGYQLILLCEYYLKTGDSVILSAIETFAEHLTSGQTAPGGWLHNRSYYNEFKDASKIGYGELNMAGLACLNALILANECGAKLNHTAFRKSIDYFKIFSGRGCVPYGAFQPYTWSPETGGKTALVGVAFDLLGRAEIAKPFISMSGTGYEHMWTGYHGGSFWNATWRPLATARDSVASFKRLTKHNTWRFNLARLWHGGITSPTPHGLEFNAQPTKVPALGLIYALPKKAIRLTGAPRSVFSRIGQLGLGATKKIYDSGDDEALKSHVKQLRATQGLSPEKSSALTDLLVAADQRQRILQTEEKQLTVALQSGDLFTADQRVTTMRSAGITVPEEALTLLGKANAKDLDLGKQYMDIMSELLNGPTNFDTKTTKGLVAMAKGKGFYADKAKALMSLYAVPSDGKWSETEMPEAELVPPENIGTLYYLVSPSLDEIRRMHMKSWMTEFGEQHPVDNLISNPDLKDWSHPDYDDSTWPFKSGPFLVQQERGYEKLAHVLQRIEFKAQETIHIENLFLKVRLGPKAFQGTIYLNGEALVEFNESPNPRSRSRGHRRLGTTTAYIKLPPVAKEHIRNGRNVLSVKATLPTHRSWSHAWMRMVDVGLAATRIGGGTWRYDPMVSER